MLSLPMLQLSPMVSAATTSMTIKEYDQLMQSIAPPGIGCFNSTYPVEEWIKVQCATDMPTVPLTVGNGVDYSADASGSATRIAYATAGFNSVSGISSESDINNPTTPCGSASCANWYSLQINSASGWSCPVPGIVGGTWNNCWEQFVFAENGASLGDLFIQYWLNGYLSSNPSCPSQLWSIYTPTHSCYIDNSSPTVTSAITPTNANLYALSFTAQANYLNSGLDESNICNGLGSCWSSTAPDSYFNLYQHWDYSEFNIFGFSAGSQASFSPATGITIVPEEALQDGSGANLTPRCANFGFTGETNNLNLQSGSCSVNVTLLKFTEYN